MNFYLIGIDYKRTPIDIREAIYWKRADIGRFWSSHGQRTAILSTCNRFEIYGVTEDIFKVGVALDIFKARFAPLFNNAYILYHGKNVLRHLVRIASGLESQIRGELQISSQLSAWAGKENFPKELSELVYDALLAAHDIRAKSGLNRPEKNIAVLVYDRISIAAKPNKLLNVVVAGTGKIAELFAAYKPQGVKVDFASRRNIAKARELAKETGGRAILLKELPEYLLNADVLVSATASPHRVFSRNYCSKISALREKELYIYDLAMPRDVDPDVRNIEGIILKSIDEVTLNDNIKNKHKAESFSR